MAHHKSAKKRIRQTLKRTEMNKVRKTKTRNAVKSLRLAITENKKEEAQALLTKAQAHLAKLAKHGVIKPNTAARRTSRLAHQVGQL